MVGNINWPLARKISLLLAGGLALAAAGAVQAAEPPFAPQGAWNMAFTLANSRQSQSSDIHRTGQPLLHYLVLDETARGALSGEVSRSATRLDMDWRYGLSDTWNLWVHLPFIQLSQSSSVTAAAGNATAQAYAAALQSRSLSGLGDLEVASVHRPLFKDNHVLALGYGFTLPVTGRQGADEGLRGLGVGRFGPGLKLTADYAYISAFSRRRWDVNLDYLYLANTYFTEVGGTRLKLLPGREITVEGSVRQELPGAYSMELALHQITHTANLVEDTLQNDLSVENQARFSLYYGSYNLLDQGPQEAPSLFNVTLGIPLGGRFAPQNSGLMVGWQRYF